MKAKTVKFLAGLGDKVQHRDSLETGTVSILATNSGGNWYYIETEKGHSIGWWHETDLKASPRAMPPKSKANGNA